MTEHTTVKEGSDIITGVIFVAVLLAVMLLSLVIIINAVSTANTNLNGITLTSVAVANESGYANNTGYTLSHAGAYGFVSPALTALYNRTSGLVVALGNATVSASGVVKNATSVVYDNLSISYTYSYDTTNSTVYNAGLTSIKNDVTGLITNFFALMPTVGTILAVVILVAGIVILVLYVRRMKGEGSESYTG